jgi:hypothetical protein
VVAGAGGDCHLGERRILPPGRRPARPASAVGDLLDEDEVRRRYYPEVVELVLRATNGEEAHVFDHLVRRREFGRPLMTLGARRGPFAGPAGRVHVDHTERSALGASGWCWRAGPHAGASHIVNVWRSIGPAPVLDTPLALCDARSVAPALVASELRYPERTGEVALVRHRRTRSRPPGPRDPAHLSLSRSRLPRPPGPPGVRAAAAARSARRGAPSPPRGGTPPPR